MCYRQSDRSDVGQAHFPKHSISIRSREIPFLRTASRRWIVFSRSDLVRSCLLAIPFLTLIVAAPLTHAQDNYEIQVYGSDLVEPSHTMVELHSNFTIDGSKTIVNGVYPTNHAEHETVEITHGFNDWFECGFYIFTSITEGQSWQWVGITSDRALLPLRNGTGQWA